MILPSTGAEHVSPSLAANGATDPAFEIKFLVNETEAQAVEAWARRRLEIDPHGDPALGGAYHTTSLYFDTPELDVYLRSSSYKRRKFRVRRYGDAPWTFLERKSKWGDRVEKRRTLVPTEEVLLLAAPPAEVQAGNPWAGDWFHRRLLMRRLAPACRIAYQRVAFVGSCPESPLRLTLDRHIHGMITSAWELTPLENSVSILTNQVILELKFRNALPMPFKELVAELRLSPRSVSKYRLCREAADA